MKAVTPDQKDKNYWAVLDAVIRLEVIKGHLGWKVTDLSRLSKVGRPLIYYYFGKSKKEIVGTAMKIIGDEFFGFSPQRVAMWERGEIIESVLLTRELMVKAPHISQFYFHWRHQKGEISDYLRNLERRYRAKLARITPNRSEAETEAIFAILFGLILFPDLSEKALRGTVDKILAFLSTH